MTVTYTVDGTDPWHQGFRAHLTIVNHGTTPVAGWTVQVSLPGDQVDWAGYPGAGIRSRTGSSAGTRSR